MCRVFRRLGLAGADAGPREIQLAAEQLNPAAPAELDLGTWVQGTGICTVAKPACYRCPLLPPCPRAGLARS
jgi:endonuclease III